MNRIGLNITPLSQAEDVLHAEYHHASKILHVQNLSVVVSCTGISMIGFLSHLFPLFWGEKWKFFLEKMEE